MNRLVIIGASRNVWQDYWDAPTKQADKMAVGNVSLFCPDKLDYIASMHRECLSAMKELRQHTVRFKWHRNENPETHGYGIWPKTFNGVQIPGKGIVDRAWTPTDLGMTPNGGSSGLFAALVGLKLGYDEIILCGCPADNGNFYDPEWVSDNFTKKRKVWLGAKEFFDGRVKSMSGYTRSILGGP